VVRVSAETPPSTALARLFDHLDHVVVALFIDHVGDGIVIVVASLNASSCLLKCRCDGLVVTLCEPISER
jgi:hypothetical protein